MWKEKDLMFCETDVMSLGWIKYYNYIFILYFEKKYFKWRYFLYLCLDLYLYVQTSAKFYKKKSPSYFKIRFVHCISKGYSNLVWAQAKAWNQIKIL